MKRVRGTRWGLLLTLGGFLPGMAAGGSMELAAQGQALLPRRDEDWSGGSGFELQVRFWESAHAGVALTVGAGWWDAVTEYAESDDGRMAVATRIQGTAEVLPVGFSLLYREVLSPRVRLLLEGGLRYLVVHSEVEVQGVYATDETTAAFRDRVRINSTLAVVLGIGFQLQLSEPLGLAAGLAYQWDVMKPEERFLERSLGKTSFDAAMGQLGLTLAF